LTVILGSGMAAQTVT